MDLDLDGKVALVTGSSKGIGRAIAEEFAKERAHVSICARGERDLASVAEALRRYGVTVIATAADVDRVEDAERVIDATVKTAGRIDILVNNAGDIAVGRTVATPDEEWRATFEANLLSAVRFTRAAVPYMRMSGGGRIINVSSAFARSVPVASSVDYNASKAACFPSRARWRWSWPETGFS